MSNYELMIGAPSDDGGAGLHAKVRADFAQTKFPLSVTFKNLMPFNVSVPQGRGFFVKAVGYHGDSVAVSVTKLDELLRIITDIMAIARVNKYPEAMIMSCDVADYAAANEPTPAPVDSAAKGKNQSSNKNGNQTAVANATPQEGG